MRNTCIVIRLLRLDTARAFRDNCTLDHRASMVFSSWASARTCLSPRKPRQTTIAMSKPNDKTSLALKFESLVSADNNSFMRGNGAGTHARQNVGQDDWMDCASERKRPE